LKKRQENQKTLALPLTKALRMKRKTVMKKPRLSRKKEREKREGKNGRKKRPTLRKSHS
jgi:hypothetical protein